LGEKQKMTHEVKTGVTHEEKPKVEQPVTPEVTEESATVGKPKKLTPKVRKKLLAKKITPDAAKNITQWLKDGLTIWECTEKYWEFPFEHNDRKTWIFYSRINNLRHKENIPTGTLSVSPEAKLQINRFVSLYGEKKLITILNNLSKNHGKN